MKNAFVQLAVHGVGGAVLGILAGFALSFLILGLMMLALGGVIVDREFPQVIHMLGMGFGALLGGIFGGIVGLKKA